ncbi:MAG TPA: heparan-alpha-glucosaminide N-acetyltransferase domain-containing protein, partial [Verrucomicrobiae bacterium]|nr:heparan-alpha-glucosaminide N-acetyltransferase domain-containing protein [Verrucomicrobiae bacterium]
MLETTAPFAKTAPPVQKQRVISLDAFRGFTIAGMIFVIMVAGYRRLPQTFPAFGSAPVSTWKHAGEDLENSSDWNLWHGERVYRPAKVARALGRGKYDVAVAREEGGQTNFYHDVTIRHPKPLEPGEDVIASFPNNGGPPSFQGIGNGCTFTDLIAPFFVFIVGVAIPFSRRRRANAWWKHVGARSLMLILAGVIYIALAFRGLSWWWGILQAIGVAYFIGAALLPLPPPARWFALAALAVGHAALSWYVPWWTHIPADLTHGYYKFIVNPLGSKIGPLNVHTTPWGSVGYGIITVIGTFVGEAFLTREPRLILRKCLIIGFACAGVGYGIHRLGIPMNKLNVSVSYDFFTGGIATLCLLAFYWIIDVWELKAWARPLTVFGSNALLAYFLQV